MLAFREADEKANGNCKCCRQTVVTVSVTPFYQRKYIVVQFVFNIFSKRRFHISLFTAVFKKWRPFLLISVDVRIY